MSAGGDPPCWAHIFNDDGGIQVVDLGTAAIGSGGAIWSLPHGGDLDANLVRLDPSTGIDAHVNSDVDVLIVVQSGTGELIVDGDLSQLAADHLVLVPKGSERSILAGPTGIAYLSIHRRRSPLGISRRTHEGGVGHD